jgi:hypothetical protein
MGAYQFKRRAERLKQRGVQVHDFGTRVLQEQCYGNGNTRLRETLSALSWRMHGWQLHQFVHSVPVQHVALPLAP